MQKSPSVSAFGHWNRWLEGIFSSVSEKLPVSVLQNTEYGWCGIAVLSCRLLALCLPSMEHTDRILMLVCKKFSAMFWKHQSPFKPASREVGPCWCWLFCRELGQEAGQAGRSAAGTARCAAPRWPLWPPGWSLESRPAVTHSFEQWLRKLLTGIAVTKLDNKESILY